MRAIYIIIEKAATLHMGQRVRLFSDTLLYLRRNLHVNATIYLMEIKIPILLQNLTSGPSKTSPINQVAFH